MSAGQWIDIPINVKVFENVPSESLRKAHAALENGFITEAEGVARFPGLVEFADLGGKPRVYISPKPFRGDMIAATSAGQVFRLGRNGGVSNVTGTPIMGGRRVIFAQTPDNLVMAAGGQLIQFDGVTTKPVSDDAPIATHVGFLDSFLLANEKDSGRWQHDNSGDISMWDPLDVFSASGYPDDINSLLVTPYGEILFGGIDSVEQFERLPSGDPPFFRRWYNGEGVFAPYTFGFADNAAFFINSRYELVRLSGQTGQPLSDDIAHTLDDITDWTDAWATELRVIGQKFILLAIPQADTPYGGKGLTYLYDYRQQKWCSLYGWDAAKGRPDRWPGWSIADIWQKRYVGGEGKIYELTTDSYTNAGVTQRMLLRTGHLSDLGELRIDNLRARLKRGLGSYSQASQISIRANRDNQGFSNWVRRDFGLRGQRDMFVEFGAFGCATSWQFEIEVTDDTAAEIVKMQVQSTPIGW